MANISRIDPFGVSGFDPFEDVFKGFFRPVAMERSDAPQLKVDVQEDEHRYIVHAEIPGVKKEDINVTIDGNHIAISAEVRREKEVKDGARMLRSERHYGKVARSFVLESEVDEAKADASYKDGVLELTLPKKSVTAAKRLTVN
ncbi:MAG TPA: Hsp20/alpha crystallin family protein [Oxalicibacterium sp.]|nr:Hsp20/alpha crystallin family protein [Oxalicibacterium sp.]